jgi:hypothetical protein
VCLAPCCHSVPSSNAWTCPLSQVALLPPHCVTVSFSSQNLAPSNALLLLCGSPQGGAALQGRPFPVFLHAVSPAPSKWPGRWQELTKSFLPEGEAISEHSPRDRD